MFKRPSHTDTEDDLLQLQQDFLSSKTQPSVQIIKPGDKRKSPQIAPSDATEDDQQRTAEIPAKDRDIVNLGGLPGGFSHTTASTSVPVAKKSRYKVQSKKTQSGPSQDVDDPEEAIDKHDSHITKVLTDIVEREFDSLPTYLPPGPTAGGFPKVLHRGNICQEDTPPGGKKRSLFAQQFAKSSAQDFGLPAHHQKRTSSFQSTRKGGTKLLEDVVTERHVPMDAMSIDMTSLISGTGLDPQNPHKAVKDIHSENEGRIAAMGQDEILAEQKKLLDMLDPSIVSFLRKKKSPEPIVPSTDSGSEKPSKLLTEESLRQVQAHKGHKSTAEKMETDMETTDLPVKPSKDWVHMDKVEVDKLSWMKDLPSPTTGDKKTGKAARFDFQGNLVGMDADLPTHLGLHHHGNEPERAGYTLEELFHLARSAHMQQRTLAINTLAKIIDNAKHGKFLDCTSTALIPAMVDGGLLFILRWALDDSTENTMVAAVNCLHALLVTKEAEEALEHVFCWYHGRDVPCLCPVVMESGTEEEESDKLSDAELLKQDIIKGLHQMSLLPRLRYILEIWKPPAVVVLQILDILIRFCYHSPQLAYQVFLCPRMMDTVFKEFLPWKLPDESTGPISNVYGHPCSRALKLIRILCTAGRNMAANIVSSYPLMNSIILYISQGQEKCSEFNEELNRLMVESLRTWTICVTYGLSGEHYREYYAVLMKMVQSLCSLNIDSRPDSLQLACTLLCLLESVTHTAANVTIQTSQQISKIRESNTMPKEMEHREDAAMPEFNWSHVSGLIQPIQLCLQNGFVNFQSTYFPKCNYLSFVAGCMNFVASWMSRVNSIPGYNAVDTMEQIEQLCEKYLIPILQSHGFEVALTNLRHNSVLLCPELPKRSESLSNLPELGALVGEKAITCPVLGQQSTVDFVLAFCRLLLGMKLHKGMIDKVYGLLLEHEEVLQYVRKICQVQRSQLATNHFAQFEKHFLETLISLARLKGMTPSMSVYHQMSLYLLVQIPEGSEHSVHQLMSTVIFNKAFMSDVTKPDSSALSLDEKLTIRDATSLSSATKQVVSADKYSLTQDALANLCNIRNTYLAAFGRFQNTLDKSRSRCEETPSFAATFMLGHSGQLLVPVDWTFLPLVELYNNSTSITAQRGVEASIPPATVTMVRNTLCWTYLLETFRPGTLNSVSVSLKLSRILCTFLAGSDLFLNPEVQSYLAALLKLYCKPTHLDQLDLTEPIPGLASFYDLYMMLLDQYEAVSFGDSIFGCYLLLPLQRKHGVSLRKAIWGEHSMALNSLFIPVNEVQIPLQRFLVPEENDLELLRLYFQSLFSRTVIPQRSPLPYLIAIHHINRFCYTQHGKHNKMRQAMMKQVLQAKDETLKQHLLYYKCENIELQFGLELYSVLPNIRQQLLEDINKL